jgi:hypothetical protein
MALDFLTYYRYGRTNFYLFYISSLLFPNICFNSTNKILWNYVDPNLVLQINFLNGIIACIVLAHIGFIIFGLFHAIWGQYFYVPFFVENTELHIGPRPKTVFIVVEIQLGKIQKKKKKI